MTINDPSVVMNFLMTGQDNATGDFVWYMNNETYYADYNDPNLYVLASQILNIARTDSCAASKPSLATTVSRPRTASSIWAPTRPFVWS